MTTRLERAAGEQVLVRCPWGDSAPDYAAYHDTEWGVELHGTPELYERMSLEAFQSGLSWITILRKRPAFRAAFGGFDPELVAAFGPADVERLMSDAGIVRNRMKIDAAIHNARVIVEQDVDLDALLWSFAPAGHVRPATIMDVPAITDESKAMAKELKKRGFKFLGPTTCYALMQATGMVDDHIATCFRASAR
ncbi:DNA-3-methyladenine glycosylase I [Lentzea jiangxiensis]|uniref:DNA-3-methyladenine glycosylase I n=1 Tax=Lentzea jiangxiensis TaxID=641025 RepID=A0A1H0T3Z9_9PSEU|nr:DNA-3-methyladenine glycosylase I [Lentzea jiangxiensis]SDP48286.1 DNA-3-methyladenine glycosylase I [Lentzea jiangxiensis]